MRGPVLPVNDWTWAGGAPPQARQTVQTAIAQLHAQLTPKLPKVQLPPLVLQKDAGNELRAGAANVRGRGSERAHLFAGLFYLSDAQIAV